MVVFTRLLAMVGMAFCIPMGFVSLCTRTLQDMLMYFGISAICVIVFSVFDTNSN